MTWYILLYHIGLLTAWERRTLSGLRHTVTRRSMAQNKSHSCPEGSPRGYRRRLLAMALEDEIPDDDAQR